MAKANYIETKRAFDEINDSIDKEIGLIERLNNGIIKLNANYSKVPSQYFKAQKEIADSTEAISKEAQKLQIQQERLNQVQNRTKISNNALEKSNISLEAAIERRNKAQEREIIKIEQAQNIYNKTQAQLNLVSKAYNDLATRKERYNNLNENEEKRLITLQKVSEKYQKTLLTVDTAIGRYTRNVGNYASGFNPLSNAISRFSQELPNLGQSFQIFAMSIGNNVGQFKEAVDGIIAQNKILAANGEKTVSVMSQIGKSLFSLNTALYAGVALFIAYGDEIGNWVSSLFEGDKVLSELTQRQKDFNNARLSGRKDAQAEILELRKYLAVINDRKLTDEQRKIAQDALLKQYPFYIRTIKDAMQVDGEYSKGVNDLIIALEKRKEVEKKSELNVINRQKLIDLQKEREELEKQIPIREKIFKQLEARRGEPGTAGAYSSALSSFKNAQSELNKVNTQYNTILQATIKNESDIIRLKKETIGLEYQEEKANKKNTDAKRADIEAVDSQIESLDGLLKRLKSLRDGITEIQQRTSRNNDEFKEYTKLIEYYQSLIDSIEKDGLKNLAEANIAYFKKFNESLADTSENAKKLSEELDSFYKQFQEGFFSDAGLPTLFKYLNGDLDKFTENWQGKFEVITQIAQEAFQFISEASNANFQNEYSNLEKQRDIALLFAGESKAGREEIERQYEERRRSIQRRQAEAEKKQALFNTGVNIAQAIVATLARTPLPAGLPFVIATAAIGAAQLAAISSQQIPQYWQGTDNHPGGLMQINDQKGSMYKEIVETPDGKKKIYEGRNVKVNAPKGTKVYTASETMDYLMFNDNLNSILTRNDIGAPVVEVNNNANFDKVGKDIVNAINEKPVFGQTFSNGELKNFLRKGNSNIELTNKRINFIPNDV